MRRRSRLLDGSSKKSLTLAWTAAIAIVAALGIIGCGTKVDQPPAAAAAADRPAPTLSTDRPASDVVASPAPETQVPPDEFAAIEMPVTDVVPGEQPAAGETPAPAMDSAAVSDLKSEVISAIPTSQPDSDAVASPALETQLAPATQTPEDQFAAIDMPVTDVMPGEQSAAEEMPASAMDSATPSDLQSEVVSAAPTPGPVDDQGNLQQPEPGDALIDFTLPRAGGGEITLSEVGGDQNIVLVFYRAFW